MSENLKKFLEEAGKNEELKKKLAEVAGKDLSPEEAIAFAKEYGFTLTAEDFKPAEDGKLSLEELDAVAGGGCNPDCKIGRVKIDPKPCGANGLWC